MSYLYDSSYLDLEIYRLLTIVIASEELTHYAAQEEDTLLDYKRIDRLRRWEQPEISRIVVSIAAIIRGAVQAGTANAHAQRIPKGEGLDREVGTLVPDLTQPNERKPLDFKEALNKVIHAKHVYPEWEEDDRYEPDPGEDEVRVFTGILHLRGDLRKKEWGACVNLRQYAMAAAALVPTEGIEKGD